MSVSSNCEHVAQLLLWRVNGSLDAAEQRRVDEHMAQCAVCRQEFYETVAALAIYQQHLPVEALVDYVFERTAAPWTRDLIEQHVAACPSCAEQLACARESRQLEHETSAVELRPEAVARADRWRVLGWRHAVASAALAVCLFAGGWAWGGKQAGYWQRWGEAKSEVLQKTETDLHAEQQKGRQETARLTEQIQDLSSAKINVHILELHHIDRKRGTGYDDIYINVEEIPLRAPFVILKLQVAEPAKRPNYSIELLDAQGEVQWEASGLVYQPRGEFTVQLPSARLTTGRYTINIYEPSRERNLAYRYILQVTNTR